MLKKSKSAGSRKSPLSRDELGRKLRRVMALERLEGRLLLTGPTAVADSYISAPNSTLNIPNYAGVLANDTGGSGPLSAVLISGPAYGSLTLNSDGSLSYTNSSYAMADGFTYEAFDGTNYSSPASVSIQLSYMSQPTVASTNFSVLHDHTLNVSAPGVLSGSSDPNHIHLTSVLVSGPSSGSLALNSDGSFSFTPNTHFQGSVSFSFKGYDGNQYSMSASDTINVTDTPPTASGQSYSLLDSQTFTVAAAQGVLTGASDPDGDSLTASLYASPSHGALTLRPDGSFDYTPNPGWVGTDQFQFTASDGVYSSGPATVYLNTQFGVASIADQTKLPVDTIHVSQQLFNMPLAYDSVLAQPDAVIEADVGLSSASPVSDTLSAALTFNGVAQPVVYFNMNSMTGSDPHVHVAVQVDTSGLASGRYGYSMVINGAHLASPVTMTGALNVVNDSASPFGKGWDMPGLLHLFNNSASGVPAGMLLSTGDGGAWYYTQGAGSSYTSPAGPYAFSTLTSVTGGGWKLVTHDGTTYNFNSSGYLATSIDRNGATTTFNWTGGLLTSIVDPFGRSIPLAYTGGLLSSVEDYARNSWTIAHTGTNLTSITEPDPGGGAPDWQYAYSGNYMSSITDPNGNLGSFTLNSFHRLSGTSLPGGATTSATSEQVFGYGSTSSGSPASLTMQTSVVPTTTDADGHTSSYQTDFFGNVVYSVDVYGNATTITRDANGLPTVVTLPPPTTGAAAPVTDIYYTSTGDETYATGAQPTYGTFTYNTFGEWATFTDSLGNEWARTFDTLGNVLSLEQPSGDTTSWTVDTYGNPLTMTQPAPNNAVGTVTTDYHYDTDERLTEIVWPDATSQRFGYDADNRRTTVEDENLHTTTTAYDVLGRIVSVSNAAGGVTSTTYDKNNNAITVEDAMANVTTNDWNSRNELIQQTLPDPDGTGPLASPVLSFTYSATGKELTATDGLGRTTTLSYDNLDRLTQKALPDPDGAGPRASPVITVGYDNLSRQVSETDALGGVTHTAYGNTDISQVTSVTAPDPDGSGPLTAPKTQYGFDGDGRRNTVTNAMNHTQTTSFTVNGQTASVADNLGNTVYDTYGHGGELLTTTDALSHTTSDDYDSRYRLIQTTDAKGGLTRLTLDGVGNTVALVDSAMNETDWTFDAINRPVTETNSMGTTTTSYDPSSDITSIEDADGRVRDFAYNNLHELTAENWMSGTTVVAAMNYGYDAGQQLVSASDPNSAYAFTHDGDGNTLTVDNSGTPGVPDVVITGGYDAAGDMTSQSATIAGTKDFLNSYSYDADQRLTMVQQQGQSGGNAVSPKEIDYAYNALSQFTTVTDFSALSGPRTDVATGKSSYDADDRLIDLSYTSNGGATTIDVFGWDYNAGNLATSFTSADGTAAYGYDPTNQLTSAVYTTATGGHQPANESYSFDANGNRNSTGYSTGSDNLITSDGTFNYAHDADGNTISRTRISSATASDYLTTYTWDYRNRLTDVEYYDNSTVLTKHVHYVYDVFNGLIGEEDDDTGSGSYNHIERYIAEGGQPILQFDGGGSLAVRYFGPVAQEQVTSLTVGGTVYWMATDNEGSVRDVIDSSGNPVDHIVYTTFGQTAYESNSAIAHWAGYAGQHLSAGSSLILSGARWYDASTGRWMSNDPSGFAGHDSNLSRYVGNNPTNGIDPTGRETNSIQDCGLGVPSLSDYLHFLVNPGQMDQGLQTAQSYAITGSFYAMLGVFALGGMAAVGISQVGVVPLEFIPTQLAVEYATYVTGGGVLGAVAKALAGNCFVAGTQVIVPSRPDGVGGSPLPPKRSRAPNFKVRSWGHWCWSRSAWPATRWRQEKGEMRKRDGARPPYCRCSARAMTNKTIIATMESA
jgi:RHS repeat-associated protein